MRRLEGHKGTIQCVAFSPDGAMVATGGEDRSIRLWDRLTGKALNYLSEYDTVHSLAFHPNGRWLFAEGSYLRQARRGRSLHRFVRRWTLPKGKADGRLDSEFDRSIAVLACSGAGGWLLAASGSSSDGRSHGGEAVWWKLGDSKAAKVHRQSHLFSGAISPSGHRFALGGASNIRVKPFEGGEPPAVVDVFGMVWDVCFGLDDRHLAGCARKEVYFWDLDNADANAIFHGHAKEVRSVKFTPDGRSLVSAGLDGAVIIWDIASGTERRRYDWGIGRCYALAVAPDGLTMAVGGDGGVVIWDLDD